MHFISGALPRFRLRKAYGATTCEAVFCPEGQQDSARGFNPWVGRAVKCALPARRSLRDYGTKEGK
jgi:hypothetical protein